MNEYKEQHPLLYDTDEESNTFPHQHRRGAYPAYSGRSKARVKGAAFIIKHWPDHLSSLMTYCWIGFGMIAITIFFIYNSVSIINVVTSSRVPMPAKIDNNENIQNVDIRSALDVFMHIFVENYEEVNDEFYLKYIKRIAKKFTDYRYNLIMVLNDVTISPVNEISAETKNDVAMRYVLNADKIIYHNGHWGNISIQYISLSNYLDNSPVKEYWRHLPFHVLEFLTRCIAIWNKGGIAFNPIIITPLSPNFRYMENLKKTLQKYKTSSNQNIQKEHVNTNQPERKLLPKVNNIQDIISILENNNDETGNIPQYNLSEADNREEPYYIKMANHNELVNSRKFKREIIINNDSRNNQTFTKINENMRVNTDISKYNSENPVTRRPKNENSTGKPLFSNSIFSNTSQTFEDASDTSDKLSFDNPGESYNKLDNITVQPSSDNSNMLMHVINIKHVPELTIDLKGNFVATKTPCHAFIGTIFSNIRHYSSNDSIKDIITDELSLFCKGMLSSCKYIDVIML